MKKQVVILAMLVMVCLPITGLADEIDTQATISFKGENPYKPPVVIVPPKGDQGDDNGGAGISKDPIIGKLPQTNETKDSLLLTLGILLIALAISVNHILFKRKGRETI